jgi:hypothetical protein
MMFCTQCGKSNPQEARFCFSCGEAMAVVALASNPIPFPSSPVFDARPEAAGPAKTQRVALRFLGSTIALGIGWLSVAGGINALAVGGPAASSASADSGLLSGFIIIVGAMAYRSLKRSRLGLRRATSLRRFSELAAIVGLLLTVLLQNDVLERMYHDPIPNIFIPLWVVIAYGILLAQAPRTRP